MLAMCPWKLLLPCLLGMTLVHPPPRESDLPGTIIVVIDLTPGHGPSVAKAPNGKGDHHQTEDTIKAWKQQGTKRLVDPNPPRNADNIRVALEQNGIMYTNAPMWNLDELNWHPLHTVSDKHQGFPSSTVV
ncbi:hypothetical protein RJ55_01740 [Drechmeria coniospora]|nr:hypothetical protein RJ55_01740 [Drechmeria coniospora]